MRLPKARSQKLKEFYYIENQLYKKKLSKKFLSCHFIPLILHAQIEVEPRAA
jgi:hypothetical protein